MLLPETEKLQQEYIQHKIRFFQIVNGYLAVTAWLLIAYAVYRIGTTIFA